MPLDLSIWDKDPLAIPPFLRRPPPTPEQLARIKRLNASIRAPKIKIRNPRKLHGKDREAAAALGMVPAQFKKGTNMDKPHAKTDGLRAMREQNVSGKTPKPAKAERAAKAAKAATTAAKNPPRVKKKTAKIKRPSKAAKTPAKAAAAPHGAAIGESGVRPGSKLEAVVALLKRPEGCTTADVLKATGWPSVSMPQQARAAGLTLTKEKVDGVTRYRAA